MDRMASRLTGDVRAELRVIEGGGRETARQREVLEQFSRPDTSHRSSYRRRMDALEDEFGRACDRASTAGAVFRRRDEEVWGIAGRVPRHLPSQAARR